MTIMDIDFIDVGGRCKDGHHQWRRLREGLPPSAVQRLADNAGWRLTESRLQAAAQLAPHRRRAMSATLLRMAQTMRDPILADVAFIGYFIARRPCEYVTSDDAKLLSRRTIDWEHCGWFTDTLKASRPGYTMHSRISATQGRHGVRALGTALGHRRNRDVPSARDMPHVPAGQADDAGPTRGNNRHVPERQNQPPTTLERVTPADRVRRRPAANASPAVLPPARHDHCHGGGGRRAVATQGNVRPPR